MRITESRIRKIISEEARRVLREGVFPEELEGVYGHGRSLDDEDDRGPGTGEGRWIVSDAGYSFEGMPELERAWDAFTSGVRALEPFMRDEFEDTESGEPASVGEIAIHQVQTFLTEE